MFDFHSVPIGIDNSYWYWWVGSVNHASEKDPVTKLCVKDDFPTALKPRMAILRWTRLGSLFGILPVRILFVSLVTWLQCQCQCPESKMLYQFFEKVPATTN